MDLSQRVTESELETGAVEVEHRERYTQFKLQGLDVKQFQKKSETSSLISSIKQGGGK